VLRGGKKSFGVSFTRSSCRWCGSRCPAVRVRLAAAIAREYDKWAAVIRDAGIEQQ
jgi:hypothetical protein